MKSLQQIDAEIQKQNFTPRALKEETGILSGDAVRSDGGVVYWFVRKLTQEITGVHYRTPQFNLALLVGFINSRTFEKNRVRKATYYASGYQIRFITGRGLIAFDVSKPVNAQEFLGKFEIGR